MKKYYLEVSRVVFNKSLNSESFVVRDSEIVKLHEYDINFKVVRDAELIDLCVGDTIQFCYDGGKYNQQLTFIQVDGGGIYTHGGQMCRFTR